MRRDLFLLGASAFLAGCATPPPIALAPAPEGLIADAPIAVAIDPDAEAADGFNALGGEIPRTAPNAVIGEDGLTELPSEADA